MHNSGSLAYAIGRGIYVDIDANTVNGPITRRVP